MGLWIIAEICIAAAAAGREGICPIGHDVRTEAGRRAAVHLCHGCGLGAGKWFLEDVERAPRAAAK